ncbi:Mn2+/Fe2+ NRAMP family transporter [Anseongella ginsenosidimutans]|uniref:Mn2+/Fe2+ NRAMP family transporter n=1 Tax=Anseongella ginsenosidimutans TaxID=496056 RepID=A0A4R3KPS1_9SPHI|nr:Nramp family divalent metal transporter [Anseongella ginsenosidimutans]QEC52201.1 divalent metal cation transporter [Anseongella ginsenosidimutans]TCS86748.1 Mn2+/Fe2+ NRAMP family transporter [Anseongella ginsenosidimutans]
MEKPPGIIRILRSLGPGIITAALVFGPGSLTLASRLGSDYAYRLLWVIAAAVLFMIIFTAMNARIGVAAQQSLLMVIREKWGRAVSIVSGIGIFLVTASFQAGNSVGVGMAFSELFDSSPAPWMIIFTLVGIGLLFSRAFYRILEKIMMALTGLMIVAFLLTMLWVRPSLPGILSGFVPVIPDGSVALIIATVASNFSIVGAFYQSYLVRQRGWKDRDVKKALNDSLAGIVILGLIGSMILITAAAVLHGGQTEVSTATDMARALQPLLGKSAETLFMCGLFGASFSSLIGNATIGGALLGDALGFGSNLHSPKVRLLIALVMILGSVVAVTFGGLPLELIVFAQSLTIFIVPFIGAAIYAVANDAAVMGKLKNSVFSNILGGIGLLILFALAFANARSLF